LSRSYFSGSNFHSGKDFFDWQFERKLDRGNFPHEHINYTKILDEEVD